MKKKIICVSVVISLLLSSLTGRIAYIALSKNYAVSKGYNSYVLTLENLYPTVYYSNGEELTNNANKYIAVLKPSTRTISDLHNLFSSSEINQITKELNKGYPILKEVSPEKVNNAKYIEIYKTSSSECLSKQLVSPSSSGLLKFLNPYGTKKIRFSTDALGRMLQGSKGEVYEEITSSNRGLKTTVNKEIEEIAYRASESINSGCVVIMDVNSSSILACITKPESSFINKPFEQYSVGSVFKIVVALCALENNVDFYYTCSGKTKVGDTEYSCQKNRVHSFQNMQAALANSCNCYFVNLALKLGRDKLLHTARELGFDDEIKLYNEWSIKSANLPDDELNSKGELALFGFGQGKLTSTPLQICYSLCTIANSGKKNQIKMVLSTMNEQGANKEFEYKPEYQAFDSDNCKYLLECLRYVVSNGTGKNADDEEHKSAGKTATAQTGQYYNSVESLNTWFAGVYPYDKPKYAIIVMCENGKSGSEDCAPVFRHIVEMLKDL